MSLSNIFDFGGIQAMDGGDGLAFAPYSFSFLFYFHHECFGISEKLEIIHFYPNIFALPCMYENAFIHRFFFSYHFSMTEYGLCSDGVCCWFVGHPWVETDFVEGAKTM